MSDRVIKSHAVTDKLDTTSACVWFCSTDRLAAPHYISLSSAGPLTLQGYAAALTKYGQGSQQTEDKQRHGVAGRANERESPVCIWFLGVFWPHILSIRLICGVCVCVSPKERCTGYDSLVATHTKAVSLSRCDSDPWPLCHHDVCSPGALPSSSDQGPFQSSWGSAERVLSYQDENKLLNMLVS